MTYYEELGVSESASQEEIREAYQSQVKRLNGVAEVLLDPAGRERYDHSLMSLAAAVAGEPIRVAESWEWRRLAPAVTAVAAILLVLIMGVWSMRPVQADARPAITRFPSVPQRLQEEWEPLATYAYESHLPIPPVPFPAPEQPLPHRVELLRSGSVSTSSGSGKQVNLPEPALLPDHKR